MRTDDQGGAAAVDDVEPETLMADDNNMIHRGPEVVVDGTSAPDTVSDPMDETDHPGDVADQTLDPPMAGPEGLETTNRFECVKCHVVNNPKTPSDICGACGEVQPAGVEKAKALVHAMQGTLGDPQAIENLERQAVGLPPKPVPLPLRGIGKAFDWQAAFEDLHQISLEVELRTREHDELKKRTKSAKDGLDLAQERLRSMFEHYYENKTKADEAPGLPFDGPLPACPIERETGAPCPACQSQRAKGGEADPSEPLHPAHPQHADVARALLVKDMDHLANLLLGKHFYIDGEELAVESVADLQVLQRYAAQKGKVPPPLLQRAHIAAEAGTDRQECKRCGLVLTNQHDLDCGDQFYPALSAVGLDCPGSPAEHDAAIEEERGQAVADAATDDPPAEPARTLPKRGSKKGKKAQPEQERTEQVTAGRKAAKKKTAKKK